MGGSQQGRDRVSLSLSPPGPSLLTRFLQGRKMRTVRLTVTVEGEGGGGEYSDIKKLGSCPPLLGLLGKGASARYPAR